MTPALPLFHRPDWHRGVRWPRLRPCLTPHCEADQWCCRRRRSSSCRCRGACGSLQPLEHQRALCVAGHGCLHSGHSTRGGRHSGAARTGSAAHPQCDSGWARGRALKRSCGCICSRHSSRAAGALQQRLPRCPGQRGHQPIRDSRAAAAGAAAGGGSCGGQGGGQAGAAAAGVILHHHTGLVWLGDVGWLWGGW